jgi:hypothetical protein
MAGRRHPLTFRHRDHDQLLIFIPGQKRNDALASDGFYG